MRCNRLTRVLVSLMLLLVPRVLRGQVAFDKGCSQHLNLGPGNYTPTAADTEFVNQVLTRLAAIERPARMSWPPELKVVNNKDVNACAFSQEDSNGAVHSYVMVHTALLREIVQNNADGLAFIMGHELGHLLLGHTQIRQKTSFLEITFGRDQELAADKYGMSWALRAGYSYDKALGLIKHIRAVMGDYSSFEALSVDHPSWTERLAALDKEQASLWRIMSAFDSGVYFLQTEQYPLAERCFRSVTKEFPDSYEAWADLGYALLMEYADALEPADLRHFGIGQIVAGGFYRRPETLEAKVRGINEEVWWDAVGALRESLRRKPDLAASYASLGIAYLIRPAGTDPGKAMEYLEQAEQLAKADTHLDPVARVSVMINLAVAYAANGSYDKFDLQEKETESILGELQKRGSASSLAARAMSYNHAFRLASSQSADDRRSALAELERYLQRSGSGSAWWELAFERYVQLCSSLNVTPKTKADFESQGAPRYRPVVTLQVASSTTLYLGEPIREVQGSMGTGDVLPIIQGTNLMHLKYPAEGIDLLANDKVLAIIVTTAQHDIPIRQSALGSSKQESLRIGMAKTDLDSIVAYDDFIQLTDPEKSYRFYSQLGLAAKILDGKVVELVLVQMPRKES